MPDAITLAEQIACVDRELAFRGRVYPRWIDKGKLRKEAADLEMRRMQAVRASLLRVQAELPDRPPGQTPAGDLFGPAKSRAEERRRVLDVVRVVAGPDIAELVEEQLPKDQNGKLHGCAKTSTAV